MSFFRHVLTYSLIIPCMLSPLCAEEEATLEEEVAESTSETSSFTPFTGQVVGSNVRVRLTPDLEGKILNQTQAGEYFVIVEEDDLFYGVEPSSGTKAYVYRTFVLDNEVEGSNVNVRLAPDLDAPIIAQLNTGDKVEGTISEKSNKWLEIAMPTSARFYIAKDYIEKVGDADFLAAREARFIAFKETSETLNEELAQELAKPFSEMEVDEIIETLQALKEEYSEFGEETARIQDIINNSKDTYLEKKVAFLEEQTLHLTKRAEAVESTVTAPVQETSVMAQEVIVSSEEVSVPSVEKTPWEIAEDSFFSSWLQQSEEATAEGFEKEEFLKKTELHGVLRPYTRPVKNIPGNFILVDPSSNTPIAFVYSTKVDLEGLVGNRITVEGNKRPNNHFAFPAYHVSAIR